MKYQTYTVGITRGGLTGALTLPVPWGRQEIAAVRAYLDHLESMVDDQDGETLVVASPDVER